jgi:hypothetical protein
VWTINGAGHAPLDVTNGLRDRIIAWLVDAGDLLARDGFESGDATRWDRAEPQSTP